MDYVVRRYRHGDEEEINRLFNSVFASDRSIDEWRWKFSEIPLGELNLVSLAEAEGQIIGQYANLPRLFQYEGQPLTFGLVVDNLVHPNFRGGVRGVQRDIFEYACSIFHEEGIVLGFGFPNRAAYLIGRRLLKYSDVGKIPVLWRRTSWRGALRRRMPRLRGPLLNAVAAATRAWSRLSLLASAPKRDRGLRLRVASALDSRFDAFWERVKSQYGIIGVRNREFLSWRYGNPEHAYEILTAERDGSLLGYAVVRTLTNGSDKAGYLVDLLVDDSSDCAAALVRYALLRLMRNAVDYVECWMMPHASLYEVLLRLGFGARERDDWVNMVYLIFDPQRIDDARIKSSEGWYVTMGDSDTF